MTTRRLLHIVLPVLLACGALHGCSRDEPPTPVAPAAVRESFHPNKPLRLHVLADASPDGATTDTLWLEREFLHLLTRGQMRVAAASGDEKTFTLQVRLNAEGTAMALSLIAPDKQVERQTTLEISQGSRLAILSQLASSLPAFLDAPVTQDWQKFIGTSDERAYDTYVRSADELLGPNANGVTRPRTTRAQTRTIERLEALTRSQPKFARAWSSLAVGYLGLGGRDLDSLTALAESTAERALRLDANLAEAHAAQGLVLLRRHDWVAAQDKFEWALTLDANTAVALEGLACLYVDAGLYRKALPFARRAVQLQPRNAGAHECMTYAQTEREEPHDTDSALASVARVRALSAFLAGERSTAERLLRSSMSRAEFDIWAAPLLRAAGNRRLVPEALRAITRAANDGYIDAATEILCGAALREAEFVFNRIERLQKDDVRAPLRILWLPQADFLRKHERFEAVVSRVGLSAFWHNNGPADICATEPTVYGCNLRGERR